ncbi:hypothetical protein [Flavobacterium degerlachei]|uniref:Uncharacterized protein n=1 Tax=Flavobacterium degerlachei TaxID=229203 RepID=A0A1H2Z2S2_9FLAO|nr:hypothetical protein [Flavobacterium degerlachei]SDX11617.1 hypothetical protein SAMN05444338_10765 [Flavobacterium degerlachei]
MNEFLNIVLYPSLFAFLGIAGTKFWDWVKPKAQKDIETADAKAKDIENDKSQLDLTKGLLDFATEQLDKAIAQIKKRDDVIDTQDLLIQDLNAKLKNRNKQFDELTEQVAHLITELTKYKQLNGKI